MPTTISPHQSKKSMLDWDALTLAQRRVAIAQDVIEQLQLGAIRAEKYHYLKGKVGHHIAHKKGFLKTSEVRSIQSSCRCCALGALMLARVAKFNGAKPLQMGIYSGKACTSYEKVESLLAGAFSKDQLRRIESAFEGWYNNLCFDGQPETRLAIEEFIDDHPDPADRLLIICQNIVDHKGTFRPEVQYEIIEE